jgi:hypothetical protein
MPRKIKTKRGVHSIAYISTAKSRTDAKKYKENYDKINWGKPRNQEAE